MRALLARLCSFAVIAATLSAQGQIRFEEVGQKSGLDFRLDNGATGKFNQVEVMTGRARRITLLRLVKSRPELVSAPPKPNGSRNAG